MLTRLADIVPALNADSVLAAWKSLFAAAPWDVTNQEWDSEANPHLLTSLHQQLFIAQRYSKLSTKVFSGHFSVITFSVDNALAVPACTLTRAGSSEEVAGRTLAAGFEESGIE